LVPIDPAENAYDEAVRRQGCWRQFVLRKDPVTDEFASMLFFSTKSSAGYDHQLTVRMWGRWKKLTAVESIRTLAV
jgi:sarcosine oxidase delta subunit